MVHKPEPPHLLNLKTGLAVGKSQAMTQRNKKNSMSLVQTRASGHTAGKQTGATSSVVMLTNNDLPSERVVDHHGGRENGQVNRRPKSTYMHNSQTLMIQQTRGGAQVGKASGFVRFN